MTIDLSQANGAAGSTYYPLNFTNTSAKACEMYGYPGVSFVTAGSGAGKQIGAAALRSTAFTKLAVRLAPGGSAHAWLKVTGRPTTPHSTCNPVTADWLKVYPPEETVAGYVSQTFSACGSASAPLLAILPVRAGKGAVGSRRNRVRARSGGCRRCQQLADQAGRHGQLSHGGRPMTAVQMTEAGKPAPVTFRGRTGIDDQAGAAAPACATGAWCRSSGCACWWRPPPT